MSEPNRNQAEPSAAPPMIPLSIEEYQRLRTLESQIEEIRSAKSAELEAKESERIKALADKGRIEEAFNQQRQTLEARLNESNTRYVELERQVFNERKKSMIAEAFAGRTFVGNSPERQAETARQVRSLLEAQFETIRDDSGALFVKDKISGRPAAEVIRESLDSPSFAHFFAPSSQGGAGVDATRSSTNHQPPKPGSLDFIAAEFKARQVKYGAIGLHPIPGR